MQPKSAYLERVKVENLEKVRDNLFFLHPEEEEMLNRLINKLGLRPVKPDWSQK